MNLTHPELVAALAKPGNDILASLTPEKVDMWHAATGISGEAGEITEALFSFELSDRTELDLENLIEEMGDMEFYLQQLRTNVGITREFLYEQRFDFYQSDQPMVVAALINMAASQILDQVKKHVVYNKPLDRDALTVALFRMECQLIIMRSLSGVKLETVLDQNIAKLSVRYAGMKYTDADAQNRADKA